MGMFYITACGNNISSIEYKDLIKKFDNKETFILYIGSSECSQCKSFSPKFETVITDYNIKDVYELDLSKLSDKDKLKFNTFVNVSGTPNVVFITKGEEANSFNRINGNISTPRIIERLKANNIIK